MLRNPISAELSKELVKMDCYVLRMDIGFNFAVTDECGIGGLREIHLILYSVIQSS